MHVGLRGRLAFGKGDVPAPFPSALAIWRADHLDIAALKARLVGCWHVKAEQLQIVEMRR